MPHYPGLAGAQAAERERAWSDAAGHMRGIVERLAGKDAVMTREVDAIATFDRKHLWHPYASTTPPSETWVAEETRGARIRLADGRELVDGMSSWWAAIHGYNHPALLEALRRQALRMPHVMFGGLTHAPAVDLGKRLLDIAPAGLERVFFCDSGSVATEAVMKMAVQYQRAIGSDGKCRFAAPLGGYHGDTLGAMSVCDPVTGMHRLFKGILPRHVFFDRPLCSFRGEFQQETLDSMEAAFRMHGHELAAVIAEPIVQGAGGMRFYHPEYLRHLRKLCDEHSVLLILDEIATGFGRTGRMFASEWAGITPDIMCVGKGLTGGMMTLAAVMAREEIARAISKRGVFMHGPTFMANPLACAVAGASLGLLRDGLWRERVAAIERTLCRGLEPCRGMAGVADVRALGAIGVVEMEEEVNVPRLQRFFVERCGVWIRPFAKLVYVMPPYVVSEEELSRLIQAVVDAVRGEEWR